MENQGHTEEKDELKKFSEWACGEISSRYAAVQYDKKHKPDADEFAMYLGFLPAIRKLPGFERPIGLDDLYRKYNGSEKNAVKKFLGDYLDIRGVKTFCDIYLHRRDYNLSPMVKNVLSFIDGDPDFDMSQLTEDGRRFFDSATGFVSCFAEYLPKGDIRAWDIGEKMGLARLSYSCGIIDKRMLRECVEQLCDMAKQSFSSFEEYMRSLIFGCGFFSFVGERDGAIKSGLDFMESMLPLLLKSDIADLQWLD